MSAYQFSGSHRTGVILVTVSAIVFSSAGIFTKAVDSGAWEIIFWRGVFAAGFTTAYIMWRGSYRQDFVLNGTHWMDHRHYRRIWHCRIYSGIQTDHYD
jgi:hypothetical protein